MIPSKYALIVQIFILLLYIYSLKLYDEILWGHKPTSQIHSALRIYHKYFFTAWNYAVQILFLTVVVSEEATKILLGSTKLGRFLNKTRTYLFQCFVFPNSLLVTTLFWGLYTMNREYVFPKELDLFYPTWLNHLVHSFILVPPLIEICLPKKCNFLPFKVAFNGITLYLFIYQLCLFGIFFRHGQWLYPFYNHFNWTQIIIYHAFVYVIALCYTSIGVYVQNLKKPPKYSDEKSK